MMTRIAIALVVALSLTACDDDDNIGDPVDDATADGNAAGVALADQISAEFDLDQSPVLIAQTGSILRALNDGEINQSSFALQVLSLAPVEDYASQLIAQHMLANSDLTEVMRTYGVGFQPTQAEAMLAADANAGISELRATPPEVVDLAFLELQIRMHTSALVMIDELDAINDTEPMQTYIDNTHDMVSDHLDLAIQIHDDLD